MYIQPTFVKLLLLWMLGFFPLCALCAEPVRILFFHTPGCRMCRDAADAVEAAEHRYGSRISVESIDLSDPQTGQESVKRMFQLLDENGISETPSFAIFLNGKCFFRRRAIASKLNAAIEDALRRSSHPSLHPLPTSPSHPVNRLGFWTITGAGLADGINPCAFATVVLLVSLMSIAQRSRKAILITGAAFSFSVFVTYFLIGLGVLSALTTLRAHPGMKFLSDIIYYGAIGLCGLFAILSIYDAVHAFRGKQSQDMLLILPESLKQRLRTRLREGVRARSMFLGALWAGVIVSILESACTGQVYFPVLTGMAKKSSQPYTGLLMLLWYNVLFILPLIIVLILSFLGVSSKVFGRLNQRWIPWTKLLMSSVFASLLVWMLIAG